MKTLTSFIANDKEKSNNIALYFYKTFKSNNSALLILIMK